MKTTLHGLAYLAVLLSAPWLDAVLTTVLVATTGCMGEALDRAAAGDASGVEADAAAPDTDAGIDANGPAAVDAAPSSDGSAADVGYDAGAPPIDIGDLDCVPTARAPYPPSIKIPCLALDESTRRQTASGSDLWPTTWGDDGHLYTAWGDGGGFGGSNTVGRVSIGVARVEGPGDAFHGYNLWGGRDPESSQPATIGKCNGAILSIGSSLFTYVQAQGIWTRNSLWQSDDHGLTWDDRGVIMNEPGAAFSSPALIQFGRGYAGARDDYVYGYGQADGASTDLFLFRVPKTELRDRSAYEFLSRVRADGAPEWSSDIRTKAPVFSDPMGIDWGMNAAYHAPSGRYLLTVRSTREGDWGIFEAPEPWGPWSTVAYLRSWLGGEDGKMITYVFPTKWMSPAGDSMWLVFSSEDSFNTMRADLVVR